MTQRALLLRPLTGILRPLLQAILAKPVTIAGMRAYIPGSLPIRLSVVMGNLRMQRMLENLVQPGAIVVDVGANIGYNTLYAAHCAGPRGRVYAIEPAQDNLAILYTNLFANHLSNVIVLPYAASSVSATRQFYMRGDTSAVNSLYKDNFYAPITNMVEVLTAPLDDLISDTPDLVKIDVEGGELDVLHGMSRMLQAANLHLIIEWHPTLQQAAGHAPDALPAYLLAHGFKLQAVNHTHSTSMSTPTLPALTARLLRTRSPVELLATR